MRFKRFVILVAAIPVLFFLLFLFKPSSAISQERSWSYNTPIIDPTYKISDDFGVVVESVEDGLFTGYFVVREDNSWVRFEAEVAPRAKLIPR